MARCGCSGASACGCVITGTGSVSVAGNGSVGAPFTFTVNISSDAGNTLTVDAAGGLYAPPVSLDGAVSGAVVAGSDGATIDGTNDTAAININTSVGATVTPGAMLAIATIPWSVSGVTADDLPTVAVLDVVAGVATSLGDTHTVPLAVTVPSTDDGGTAAGLLTIPLFGTGAGTSMSVSTTVLGTFEAGPEPLGGTASASFGPVAIRWVVV